MYLGELIGFNLSKFLHVINMFIFILQCTKEYCWDLGATLSFCYSVSGYFVQLTCSCVHLFWTLVTCYSRACMHGRCEVIRTQNCMHFILQT